MTHILTKGGNPICGRKLEDNAGECCERCAQEQANRDARTERREQLRLERIERLKKGVLCQINRGMYALRYLLDDKLVTQSIGERNEQRAKMMAPMCMVHIRRTGRKLRTEPKCFADSLP